MPAGGTHIELCGRLGVEIDGVRREEGLRGRQGRLALAFLVLNRERPVRRDELVAAVWSAEGPPPSDKALAPVLSRLRQAIAPATLEGRDSLTLQLPEPVWIDVEAARDALAAAGEALEREDAAAALRLARETQSVTEGGLMPGHEAPWLDEQRAALEDLRVEALEHAARAGILAGWSALPRAEADARAAVGAAPFRESARAALIEVLAARGNVAEAIRAYEDVRTLLREELGTVPGRRLVELHATLLDSTADGAAVAAAPRAAPSATGLVERDAELGRIDAALRRLAAARGGVLLLEGPAGIGKTRLLAEVRTRAERGGARVLDARAGLLEREFGFGLVRQLFLGVVEDEALTEGPARAARTALTDAGATDGTFPVLDGLHHLVLRLAAERPLVLAADDLQWGDPASLRFLAYLARRIGDRPVLIAATVRTGEPDADEALLGELSSDPESVVVRPRALTAEGTAGLVRERLGEADPAFAAACQEVTAGNPLLVAQLLRGLADADVAPDAAHADEVREIGPRAVSRTVLLRLARMPPAAAAVARAAAVLGEQPGLPALAALAGTDEEHAVEAIQALARAEILRAEEPLGFVHPLVRDAVYHEMPAPARGLEHARAARLLAGLGAPPERVAAQLLQAPPRGAPWVVAQLRAAADVAMRRGAPDAALTLLERAQAEPPPPDEQAALALELGGSAAYLRGPAGIEPLQRAYAGLTDPVERGRAAIRLSHLLLFVRSPQEGVAVAQQAADALPPGCDDLAAALLAVRLIGVAFGAVDPAEFATLQAVRTGPRGDGPGARALTAMTALATALVGGPAAEASALAREAFAGGGLERLEITASVALAVAVLSLGDPAEGLIAIDRYTAHARRQGEILGSIGADLWGGFAHILAGDLVRAIERLDRAHEGERLWGTKLDAVMAYSAAFLAQAWLERGDPVRARSMIERLDASDGTSDGARFWQAAHAELLLAEGDPAAALGITLRLEPMRPPDTHPVWAPWRSLRARALAALGRREEALALAAAEADVARRVGAPWVAGRALRALAELSEGDAAVEHARAALELLEGSSAHLELAKARAALAGALAATGRADEAEPFARGASDLAAACGADVLAARLEQPSQLVHDSD